MNCYLTAAARWDQSAVTGVLSQRLPTEYVYKHTLGNGHGQLAEASLTAATVSDFELNIFLPTVAIYTSHLHECPLVPSCFA